MSGAAAPEPADESHESAHESHEPAGESRALADEGHEPAHESHEPADEGRALADEAHDGAEPRPGARDTRDQGGEATARGGPGMPGASGESAGPHDRAREGFEHLQAAARELIQAARAMLDVAEDLVDDPEAVAHVVGTVGSLGDLVRTAAGVTTRRPAADRPANAGGPAVADRPAAATDRTGRGRRGRPGVERITVL